MAKLTTQITSRLALDLSTATASASGDTFANTGKEMLYIAQNDSANHNVTVAVQAAPGGKDVIERVLNAGHPKVYILGPFDPAIYNDSDGLVHVSYSAVTNINVAVFKPGNL